MARLFIVFFALLISSTKAPPKPSVPKEEFSARTADYLVESTVKAILMVHPVSTMPLTWSPYAILAFGERENVLQNNLSISPIVTFDFFELRNSLTEIGGTQNCGNEKELEEIRRFWEKNGTFPEIQNSSREISNLLLKDKISLDDTDLKIVQNTFFLLHKVIYKLLPSDIRNKALNTIFTSSYIKQKIKLSGENRISPLDQIEEAITMIHPGRRMPFSWSPYAILMFGQNNAAELIAYDKGSGQPITAGLLDLLDPLMKISGVKLNGDQIELEKHASFWKAKNVLPQITEYVKNLNNLIKADRESLDDNDLKMIKNAFFLLHRMIYELLPEHIKEAALKKIFNQNTLK